MLALIFDEFRVPIVSSRAHVEGQGEWRSTLAEEMWCRLCAKGQAMKLSDDDRYIYPASAHPPSLNYTEDDPE